LLFRQSHQDVVSNEIRLAEVDACGVQALENELRVICAAIERNIDDNQAIKATIDIVWVG
jgi:uncharacterized sporulation protein YeaH/YhbH (DUF444 family)